MPRTVPNPATMRAVAHPLRMRILSELWDADAPLRAKDLAEALGEPANSVSYHVRRLRDAGYVQDAEPPEGSTARDRWYEAPVRGIQGAEGSEDSPETAAAFGAVMRTVHTQIAEQVITAQEKQIGPLLHVDGFVWLPQDVAAAFTRRLSEISRELRRAAAEARETAAPSTPFTRYTYAVNLVAQTRDGEPLTLPAAKVPQRDAIEDAEDIEDRDDIEGEEG